MKKFSKIVAGMLLAGMTMLSVGASAEETQESSAPRLCDGCLYFAQSIEKANKIDSDGGYNQTIYFDDLNSMLLALQAKKIVEIGEIPQPVAEYICNHNSDLKAILPHDKKYQGNLLLRMSVVKENTKVADLLNSAIKELQANGKLDALQKKYVDAYLQNGKEPKPIAMPKFKDAQVLKIAVTGDLPPIDLVAADGTPAGFNVAMLAEIAKLKKVNIIPIPMNSGARFLSLTKGIVDVIFSVDEAVYNDSKNTEIYADLDIPATLKTTVPYAKYVINNVARK